MPVQAPHLNRYWKYGVRHRAATERDRRGHVHSAKFRSSLIDVGEQCPCNSQAASLCAGATSKPTRGKCTFTFPTEGSSCRMTISSAVQASIAPCTGLP
jgi:hypothetical protein